jgi:hypothetical protein
MSRLTSFPRIDLTSFTLDDKVVAGITSAAYLAIGLGVAAIERLDGVRRTATSAASDAAATVSDAFTDAVAAIAKRAA